MTSPVPVRWGLLGPGRITRAFAVGLREAAGAEIVAVGSRDRARAEAFAAEVGIPRAHGSYADLAADPEVDAIYVGTPHAVHCAHALLCLDAGKPVLCEKPLALNAAEARRMIAAARARGLPLMEAMWTRFLPAIRRVRELVALGAIGDVRSVFADFGFRAPDDPRGRHFAPGLGGGALLDIGIYPLTLSRLLCGPPVETLSQAELADTGVDAACSILLRHAGGRLSMLSASFLAETPGEAHVVGDTGRITLRRPWWDAQALEITDAEGCVTREDHPHRGGGFAHEAEAFMELVRTRRVESGVMPLDESLALLELTDRLRVEWGVRYPGEDA